MFSTFPILQKEDNLQKSFTGIKEIPGLIIVKDVKSNYFALTPQYSSLLGWENADQGIGLTDFDIPSKAAEAADDFVKIDQKVINIYSTVTTIDICEFSTGWRILLSNKTPIINYDDEITGIYVHLLDISHTSLYQWYLPFNFDDLKFTTPSHKSNSYILSPKYCPLSLSPRYQTCLFLLVRGKSAKQIASILKISPRTVETYLENIKFKLNCYSKSDLIEKAIHSGFMNYIPSEILQNSYPFFN